MANALVMEIFHWGGLLYNGQLRGRVKTFDGLDGRCGKVTVRTRIITSWGTELHKIPPLPVTTSHHVFIDNSLISQ